MKTCMYNFEKEISALFRLSGEFFLDEDVASDDENGSEKGKYTDK